MHSDCRCVTGPSPWMAGFLRPSEVPAHARAVRKQLPPRAARRKSHSVTHAATSCCNFLLLDVQRPTSCQRSRAIWPPSPPRPRPSARTEPGKRPQSLRPFSLQASLALLTDFSHTLKHLGALVAMGRYAVLVTGPAGSGKSTLCTSLLTHAQTIGRNLHLFNLDPAAENFEFKPTVDIRDLIGLEDVMQEMQLGPNGGLVYCFEYVRPAHGRLCWCGQPLNGVARLPLGTCWKILTGLTRNWARSKMITSSSIVQVSAQSPDVVRFPHTRAAASSLSLPFNLFPQVKSSFILIRRS